MAQQYDNDNRSNDNGEENRGNGKRKKFATAKINNETKKKKSVLFKFGVVFVSIAAALLLISSAIIFGYFYITGGFESGADLRSVAEEIGLNLKQGNGIAEIFKGVQERTSFIILGVDNDGQSSRTDTIMVGCFNSATKELNIISIPRDTYVIMPEERRVLLTEPWQRPPSDGIMKINAPYNYGGKKYGLAFAVKQVEELLNISIDYYVMVDTEAFRFIVDQIGGVYFDVPQRMYYRDPNEDLFIDLQPGPQLLMGAEAEMLVRYRKTDEDNPLSRSYPSGDLERIKVQQEFMVALISQAVTKDKLLGNAPALVEMVDKYIDTNMPLTDALKYIGYIKDVREDNIKTHSLPGEAKNIVVHGKNESFYMPDYVAIEELVNGIFYSPSK